MASPGTNAATEAGLASPPTDDVKSTDDVKEELKAAVHAAANSPEVMADPEIRPMRHQIKLWDERLNKPAEEDSPGKQAAKSAGLNLKDANNLTKAST